MWQLTPHENFRALQILDFPDLGDIFEKIAVPRREIICIIHLSFQFVGFRYPRFAWSKQVINTKFEA